MAIYCANCEGVVSPTVAKCIHCGHPITTNLDSTFRHIYAYSGLARIMDVVALVFLILSFVVHLYLFIQVDWTTIGEVPLNLAVAIVVVASLPGFYLMMLAMFTMSAAHLLEYVASIARK